MECNFVVGQKVVCVDANIIPGTTAESNPSIFELKEGEIYTITYVGYDAIYRDEGIFVRLKELSNRCAEYLYWRFKPLTEQKTDISIFKKMERPNKAPVKQKELV